MSLYGAGHICKYPRQPTPSWGSTTGGQEGLGQGGQGQGPCWLCLWPVRPLSRTGPLPLEDLRGCFQSPVCKHSRRLYPQAAHSPPKSGRKALWGGPLLGPLAVSQGTSLGFHTQRPSQKHMQKSVHDPAHSESSSKREWVRQLLAASAAPTGWKGAEPTLGHSGPVALPAFLWELGQRGVGHPTRFSPLNSDRGPWLLGCCSVETAPFSTSTPNRNQLRPRP